MSNVLVMGHADHGKGTFCEMLGLPHRSSSEAALEIFLFDVLNGYRDQLGLALYETHNAAYLDRGNWRSMWYDEICKYNRGDRARLAREILKDYRVYDGMRDIDEYEACMKEGLFDYVYWVDASKRKPQESPSSFNISFDPKTMVFVDNNYPEEDLKIRADEALYIMETLDGSEPKFERNYDYMSLERHLRGSLQAKDHHSADSAGVK